MAGRGNNRSSTDTLTNNQIIEYAKNSGMIENFSEKQVKGVSYDLRVGKTIMGEHDNDKKMTLIQPGGCTCFKTFEKIKLPKNIYGTVFGMNCWTEKGLLVLNPGHVDPGFEGHLTITCINLYNKAITIDDEADIFTIIFNSISLEVEPEIRQTRANVNSQKIMGNLSKSITSIIEQQTEKLVNKDDLNTSLLKHYAVRGPILLSALGLILSIGGWGFALWDSSNAKYFERMVDIQTNYNNFKNRVDLFELNNKHKIEELSNNIKLSQDKLLHLQKEISTLKQDNVELANDKKLLEAKLNFAHENSTLKSFNGTKK